MNRPKQPCNGFPSQSKAIVAMHQSEIAASDIARTLGIPINNVTRAIHAYRVKTGHHVEIERVRTFGVSIPSENITDYRMYNWEKSREGARQALREIEFGT